MESHAHTAQEVYIIQEGCGFIGISGEEAPVRAGDVVYIPSGAEHTLTASPDGPLLWVAFWWED
jgi:mannose-6-phosphate isomerase-like protein (cupin superfamily)